MIRGEKSLNKYSLVEKSIPDLSPWVGYQTENIPSRYSNQHKSKEMHIDLDDTNYLPRILYKKGSSKLENKVELKMSKKDLVVDEKSRTKVNHFERGRQTSFNGFVTKFKIEDKNRGYLLASKEAFFKPGFENKVKFINLNSKSIELENQWEPQNEEEEVTPKHHGSKEHQFCRKRSLNHLIKSMGRNNIFEVRSPRVYSPWLQSSQINKSLQRNSGDHNQTKIKKTIKLMELNLGIRKKNLKK